MRIPGWGVVVLTGVVVATSGVTAPAGAAAPNARRPVHSPERGVPADLADRQPNVLIAAPDTRVQQSVLGLVNLARRARGCPVLRLDDRLMVAARDHAAEMADHEYFAHRSLGGSTAGERVTDSGYDWSRYAENIARGQVNPRQVVDDWMDSPAHRDNILDCRLRQVGVGLAFDVDHTAYWVQDFASPR